MRDWYVVHHNGKRLSPAAQAFVDFILHEQETVATALSSPLDIVLPDQQVPLGHHDYLVLPRSVVVFEGR
jgi:hypothetical protein